MKKARPKKSIGLKKVISFLSLLPFNYRTKVISHLSIFEQNKIYNKAYEYGGFSRIEKKINIEKLKYFNNEINKIKNKQNKFLRFDLLLTIIFFIFGFSLLIFQLLSNSFERFLSYFIIVGYSAIFAPTLALILVINNKFSWKINFTSSNLILRHIGEAFISSILLIILLLQVNAISNNFAEKDLNIFHLIYGIIFIPFFEELLYRYLLMTIILRKADRFLRVLLSTLIFSLMHFPFTSILSFFLYFLSSLILSLLYSLENYLFPTFLAHSIANFVILIV